MSTVRVTRDRHPMRGQQLQVLGQQRRQGQLELLVVLPDGSKALIPAAWTDLDSASVQDAGETPGAAALGSLAQLLHASTMVRALLARAQQREQAARQSPCEEDNHAACAVESDTRPGSGASTERVGPAFRSASHRRGRGAGVADRQDRQPDSDDGHQRGGR